MRTNEGNGRVVVSSYVDEVTADLLDALAEVDGVTRSTLVREVLQDAVARRTVRRNGHRVPRKGSKLGRRPIHTAA